MNQKLFQVTSFHCLAAKLHNHNLRNLEATRVWSKVVQLSDAHQDPGPRDLRDTLSRHTRIEATGPTELKISYSIASEFKPMEMI